MLSKLRFNGSYNFEFARALFVFTLHPGGLCLCRFFLKSSPLDLYGSSTVHRDLWHKLTKELYINMFFPLTFENERGFSCAVLNTTRHDILIYNAGHFE